jgi:hypothetical protein
VNSLELIEDGKEDMNYTNYFVRRWGSKIVMAFTVLALLVGLFFMLQTVFAGKIHIIYLKLEKFIICDLINSIYT